MNLYPKVCNICGGDVIYTSNARIYGREYGSGKCYLCTNCGAFVGTHRPRPKEAMGILANAEMRELRKQCHDLFDTFWKGKKHALDKRGKCYAWLAGELNIPVEEWHFGYFDKDQLERALVILKERKGNEYKEPSRAYTSIR